MHLTLLLIQLLYIGWPQDGESKDACKGQLGGQKPDEVIAFTAQIHVTCFLLLAACDIIDYVNFQEHGSHILKLITVPLYMYLVIVAWLSLHQLP